MFIIISTHNAIIEKDDEKAINQFIQNLLSLVDKGLLWTNNKNKTLSKELRVQQIYPVIENLIFSLLLLNAYVIPQQKLARLFYNVVEGGFYVSQDVEVFNQRSMNYFSKKLDDLEVWAVL